MLFRSEPAQFELAQSAVRVMAEFGCQRMLKTPQELVAIEPALGHALSRIVGGDYAAEDESGDACAFTQRLAAHCVEAGVAFRTNVTVNAIESAGGAVSGVQIADAVHGSSTLTADAYVVALGSHSPKLLRPLGLNPLIYPVKGYSLTIPVADSDAAPHVSLTDDEHKLPASIHLPRCNLASQRAKAATQHLLVELRQLPADRSEPIVATRCGELAQGLPDAIPGLVDDRGALVGGNRADRAFALGSAPRQESLEHPPRPDNPRCDDGGKER